MITAFVKYLKKIRNAVFFKRNKKLTGDGNCIGKKKAHPHVESKNKGVRQKKLHGKRIQID